MAKEKPKRKWWKWILGLFLLTLVGGGGYLYYKYDRLEALTKMDFQEMLEFTLKDQKDAAITVAIVKPDGDQIKLYGENGKELDLVQHQYEIGSISKTFTGALISEAVEKGKIDLDATIDKYLPLQEGKAYPTVKQLVTHTSGYKNYYLSHIDLSTFFNDKNSFHGATKPELLRTVYDNPLKEGTHDFAYSNFGISVLGLILENVNQRKFTNQLNQLLVHDLGMKHSYISDGKKGDLGKYWQWTENDGYLPAGAIVSTIDDMIHYLKLQMTDEKNYLTAMHESLAVNNHPDPIYQKIGIAIEEIGMTWMIDKDLNAIWHNGATGNYNSYLGFNKEKGIGVIILSNLSNDTGIPATIMGPQLMEEILGE